ncbi:MAG: hypothetical protein JWN27_1403 [Candidatus Eremiobacteraeota bacterium]|nr:hypothetical protein [Candidatus Eremiobacteraeota bacterium]
MPFVRSFALLSVVLLAASAAPVSAAADGPVEIHLNAMNGSGESGTAILTPQGAKTIVELKMTGAPGDPQPAHFHSGTCESYAPRPLYPLRAVVKGGTTTTLDVPIDKLLAGDLVINVHKSFDDIATVVSCTVAKKA